MKAMIALAALATFGLWSPVQAANCSDATQYPEVSGDEMAKLAESKAAMIVDANGQKSYDEAHVPGAVHYGKGFAAMLPEKKDTLIVAYCGGPGCGAWKKAAEEACEKGYTNIKHYKGGISEWKKRAAKKG